ncbi:MAG TPA: valine--tRNA ligase, partial [bacterium]|nr:valine--tRNA ligase [bacterium]
KFHYFRYPIVTPAAGGPTHVAIATTRPETMLGDTAVAVHPDPAGALERAIAAQQDKVTAASSKDQADARRELERLEARRHEVIPTLVAIAELARNGGKVRLPLVEREIPIILDEWADPTLGTGCVKITPAHDPNDYDVWQRHPEIGAVNMLNPDGTVSKQGGRYAGLDRFEARARVLADLDAEGLLDRIEDRQMEIDHSDRSKTIIEPYLSKQWFVNMADVEGGVVMGRGTDKEFRSPGLAQAALDATAGTLPPFADGSPRAQVAFHPDPDRYRNMHDRWLGEKRDWCISRQLWWGHRIPVWRGDLDTDKLLTLEPVLQGQLERDDVCAWVVMPDGERMSPADAFRHLKGPNAPTSVEVQICFLDAQHDQTIGAMLQSAGLELDPDVLDTWFSSALWPHSTLGWPNPNDAPIAPGQTELKADGDRPDALSYFYPGSCLVTGRDIITLWVARMIITGLYNLGDVPFTDVFLHATILDGKGVRMSKSKGNGIDPLDIIHRYGADALRYVVCELQTGTQDVRLPVQAISPFTAADEPERLVDLATAKPGPYLGTFIDPVANQPMDLIGQYGNEGITPAKATSDRFAVGANFCNKLFNAARFAFLNLDGTTFEPLHVDALPLEDRWVLSRLHRAIATVHGHLETYNPSAAVQTARDFFWNELCDWYLEMLKPRMKVGAAPDKRRAGQQVLASVLDQTLRLLHPFVPFLTERLWATLNTLAPTRGIGSPFAASDLLVHAAWPTGDEAWPAPEVEANVATMQEWCVAIREARARYQVAPRERLAARFQADGNSAIVLRATEELLANMAGLSETAIGPDQQRTSDSAIVVHGDSKAFLLGVVDLAKEKARLEKEAAKLTGRIASIEKKLANEGFLAKAPAEVVAKERDNLGGVRAELAGVQQALADLGVPPPN